MAYITPIGSNPEQINYRLGEGHDCDGPDGTHRQFAYHTNGAERPLRWIGRGLADVGIEAGSVLDESQFDMARELMAGRDPHTGEVLVEAKRGIPDDAKLALGPLVRAVEQVAAEADVSTADVLGHNTKLVDAFARAQRAVDSRGEAARLRADEAGKISDAAGVSVEAIWGGEVYDQAAANLWEQVVVRKDDGSFGPIHRPRRVITGNAGYDASVTLPKSFSWLTAIANEDTALTLEQQVFMRNAERGFGWLESTTAYGMRGTHGRGKSAETVPGSGFLGWSMVHRAARPTNGAANGDPHWHVHFTIANMTKGDDGRWSTVAAGGRDLMRHAAALDHLVKALVRHDLHQQYGMQFYRNSRTGAWEIAGIPDETLAHFSKRHNDITDALQRMGYDREEANRAVERSAEQRSRGRKGEATTAPDATLREVWQGEERGTGRDLDEQRQAVFGNSSGDAHAGAPGPDSDGSGGSATAPTTPSVGEIAAQLRDPDCGLTAHSRRFTRADALARVADELPYGCSSPEELERLTDQVLTAAGFRSLPEYGRDVEGPNGQREYLAAEHMANAATYTTDDVVDAETTILRTAKASHPGQLATRVDEDTLALGTNVAEAGQSYALDEEQRAALRRVTTSGRALDSITGLPGSGKTTLMRAFRMVYEAAGFVVGGAATAAVAGENLQRESGISSRTVASYLDALTRGQEPLLGVDALVLDEANLTNDRDRTRLYQHAAETETQIIEVGDAAQLRGVGVGSLFGRLHEILGGAELRNNYRQADEDERSAIAAFRKGRYAEAYTIWHGNARFHATEQAEDTTAAMIADWVRFRAGAPDAHTEQRGLAMLAATNAVVDRLNTAAQATRLAEGELGAGRSYAVAGGTRVRLHVGDHVVLRVNDRAGQHTSTPGPPVLNGYRAVVGGIGTDGTLTVEWQAETADGMRTETAQLSPRYVGIGGVELGYALTIHRAEGLTVGGRHGQWQRGDGEVHSGRVLVHAPGADAPGAYVALSRHKEQVDIYGSLDELETEQQRYLLGKPRTQNEVHDRAIEQLAEKARATAVHGDDRPVVVDLGIAEFLSEAGAEQQAATARRAERDEAERLRAERHADQQARKQRRAERRRARAEREQAEAQRREWSAALLREVWRHEPDLAEKVIALRAFAAVARNLAAADEAGYDPRDVLADLSTSRLTQRQVRDPARRAAWGIDHAVERLRTGERQQEQEHAAEREQMREQATDLLLEAWSQRPELVAEVADSGDFDRFVHALADYTDAGLDPRELIGQINTSKLAEDPAIRDRGAFAVYSLRRVGDQQLDEIAEAEQRAAEREERVERIERASELVRQVWSQAPQLAKRLITHEHFGYFAGEVDKALDAGLDPAEIFGQFSPEFFARPELSSMAGAATAWFRHAAESAQQEALPTDSSHTGQPESAVAPQEPVPDVHAGPEEPGGHTGLGEQNAERIERASELVRQVWSQAPHVAERLIRDDQFERFAGEVAAAANAGLDPAEVLGELSPSYFARPELPSMAGAATAWFRHTAQQHAQRTEPDHVDQTESAVAPQELQPAPEDSAPSAPGGPDDPESAERTAAGDQRIERAAELVRQVWSQAPQLAKRLITHEHFGYFAGEVAAAANAGLDPAEIFGQFSPEFFARPELPSMAGAATAWFRHTAEAAKASRAADQPDPGVEPEPVVQQDQPTAAETQEQAALDAAAPADPVPHWSEREHGALSDQELAERLDTALVQAQRTAVDREEALQRVEVKRAAAEAGQGAEVRTVGENLAQLREQAATVGEVDAIEAEWQATVERAAHAAEQRAAAEADRDGLGRFAGRRRAELDARIAELAGHESTAQAEASRLAERAGEAQQSVGDHQQRRRVLTRARAAEADQQHARAAAQHRDEQAAEVAERLAARLAEQQPEHEAQIQALESERQIRAELAESTREAEHAERAEALQPAEVTAGEREVGATEPELGAGIEHTQQAELDQHEPTEPGDLEA